MTIFFCDMKDFTAFSEGMTPAALVTVLNRYMTVMSEPVRRHNGIIDKYIGDEIMAFWGPPFTGAEEHARLACLAALDQLAGLAAFRAELPELTGLRRGVPEIDIRIGIATGDAVVGSIGSEQTRNYTVIGDTVNLASRLVGVNKTYGTRALVSEATSRFAADVVETREIDSVLVVGKTEPHRIFELLGRKGEVAASAWRCATPMSRRSAPIAARPGAKHGQASRAASGLSPATGRASFPQPHRPVLHRSAQPRLGRRVVFGGEVAAVRALHFLEASARSSLRSTPIQVPRHAPQNRLFPDRIPSDC